MDKKISASAKDAGQNENQPSVAKLGPIHHSWVQTAAPQPRRSSNLPNITFHGYPNMDVKFSGALPVQSSFGELSINRYYPIDERHPNIYNSEDELQNTDLAHFCGTSSDTKGQRAHINMALKFSTAAGRIAVFSKSASRYKPQSSGSGFWIAERYFITAAHFISSLSLEQVQGLYNQTKPQDGGLSAWVSTKLRVTDRLGNDEYQVFLVAKSDEDVTALFKIVDDDDLPPYTLAYHDLEAAEISSHTPIFTIAYPGSDQDLNNQELTELAAKEPTIAPLIKKLQQMKGGRVSKMDLLYERYLMTESDMERREWIKQNFREFETAFRANTKSLCTGVSMARTQPAKTSSVSIDMHMSAFYQCSGGMVCYLRKTTKGFVPKVIGIVSGTSPVNPHLNNYTGFTRQGVLALQKRLVG